MKVTTELGEEFQLRTTFFEHPFFKIFIASGNEFCVFLNIVLDNLATCYGVEHVLGVAIRLCHVNGNVGHTVVTVLGSSDVEDNLDR